MLFSYRFPPSGSEEDFHHQVTNQAPYLIGWRLRATRHAWRTHKKGGVMIITSPFLFSLIIIVRLNLFRSFSRAFRLPLGNRRLCSFLRPGCPGDLWLSRSGCRSSLFRKLLLRLLLQLFLDQFDQ